MCIIIIVSMSSCIIKKEEDFNKKTEDIEKVINSIKNILSIDYHNKEVITITFLENLDKAMETFDKYINDLKSTGTIVANIALAQLSYEKGYILDTKIHAVLLLYETLSKINAYLEIYDLYSELIKVFKKTFQS